MLRSLKRCMRRKLPNLLWLITKPIVSAKSFYICTKLNWSGHVSFKSNKLRTLLSTLSDCKQRQDRLLEKKGFCGRTSRQISTECLVLCAALNFVDIGVHRCRRSCQRACGLSASRYFAGPIGNADQTLY